MAQHLIDPVIQKLEEALPAYIAGRRWFRAKAQTISAVTIKDIVHADGFLILLANVQYAAGGSDLYLLPVTAVNSSNSEEFGEDPISTLENPEGGKISVYDAVHSPFFRTILFRALSEGAEFQGQAGVLIAPAGSLSVVVEGTLPSKVSRAEQSNTSIIYGSEFILKLFRKIEAGINPDIEIGAFLTGRGFRNTPAVIGLLEYRSNEGEVYSAGILQDFVPNQGDAWKYTLESLSGYFERALNSNVLEDQALIGDFAKSATLLGVRTAEMHVALASASSEVDFTSEPFTSQDAIALSEEITAQASKSFEVLRAKLDTLPQAENQLANQVLGFESRIYQLLTLLKAVSTEARRIRFHGDYHLGQVLAAGSDFMIIDFEGEPARPLSERRFKGLALRDVAGMLRSFQYAAYAGLYGLVPGLPDDPPSLEKIAHRSAYWNSEVAKLYLDAYFETANNHSFVPATPEQRRVFLDAFLLQKALYEVQYELNNRPDWVGIPLRGIIGLMEA